MKSIIKSSLQTLLVIVIAQFIWLNVILIIDPSSYVPIGAIPLLMFAGLIVTVTGCNQVLICTEHNYWMLITILFVFILFIYLNKKQFQRNFVQNMNKILLTAFISSFVIFLVVSYIWADRIDGRGGWGDYDTEKCGKYHAQNSNNGCYMQKALETHDPYWCDLIQYNREPEYYMREITRSKCLERI